MQKTALIFGITGQDGSYLADLLLAKGYYVVGVARRVSVDTTTRLCAAKRHDNFTLAEGDVTDPLCVQRLITTYVPFEVYNLAAMSHVGTSFEQPSYTFDVTAKGVLNCLEAIRTLKKQDHSLFSGGLAPYPRFYQASSSEMFGSAYSRGVLKADGTLHKDIVNFPDDMLAGMKPVYYQDEETPFRPNSPYAIAKLAGHHLVRLYRDAYGIHASSGILFNHESGRRGDTFVTRKISLWVAGLYKALSDRKFCEGQNLTDAARRLVGEAYPRIKLGNIDSSRDWGHAKDYVEAMWLMLQQDKPDDYVVATGETHTVREFLETALQSIGVNLLAGDVVDQDKSLLRPSEVPYLRGDASKGRAKLGWSPKTSFSELVHLMVFSDIGLRLGNGRGCS